MYDIRAPMGYCVYVYECLSLISLNQSHKTMHFNDEVDNANNLFVENNESLAA